MYDEQFFISQFDDERNTIFFALIDDFIVRHSDMMNLEAKTNKSQNVMTLLIEVCWTSVKR